MSVDEKTKNCKSCDGGTLFPHYGLAPHTHQFDENGTIIFGSTKIEDKAQYPPNFDPDPDVPGCGVYYCLDCSTSLEEAKSKSRGEPLPTEVHDALMKRKLDLASRRSP